MVSEVKGDTNISAVAVKLPPWFEDTELWLKQIEAAFEICRPRITLQKTKYYHLLSALPAQILKLVADKLDPEVELPYDQLVNAIRVRYRPSTSYNFEVIRNAKLDGRRPYELLSELKENFRHLDSTSENMLRESFIRAMPDTIKNVLIAAAKYTSMDGLVEIADNMLSKHNDRSMNYVNTPEEPRESVDAINAIQQQIQDLKIEVMNISRDSTHRQVKRRVLCYYHRKFGTRAYKCNQPCNWKENRTNNFKRTSWNQEN